MKVVSASVHQFQTPVLKGKETNPVIQIKIETEGNITPVTLREISLKLSGTDIQNDIQKVEIMYSEERTFLQEGIRFGIPEKPQEQITFAGNQKLYKGINFFWVSIRLKESASILNEIKFTCESLKVNDQIIIPENMVLIRTWQKS